MSLEIEHINHRMIMDQSRLSAKLLEGFKEGFERFIKAEKDMHSHAHITNPTLYHQAINSNSLKIQLRIAKACVELVEAWEEFESLKNHQE